MRRAYAKRQQILHELAEEHLQELLELESAPSGMHVVARLSGKLLSRMDDQEASRLADENGVTAVALSGFYVNPPVQQGLLLGYAGFDAASIEQAVKRLAEVFRGA